MIVVLVTMTTNKLGCLRTLVLMVRGRIRRVPETIARIPGEEAVEMIPETAMATDHRGETSNITMKTAVAIPTDTRTKNSDEMIRKTTTIVSEVERTNIATIGLIIPEVYNKLQESQTRARASTIIENLIDMTAVVRIIVL